MSGFAFEQHKGYCVVRFETELHEMSWGDVEKEAAEVVGKLKAGNTSRMIVDLSPMDLIQSGLVASLVRMWKATEGHADRKVVVVSPNEVVREVIRSAGLFKVFTVVDSREEGAYEIGVSKGAQLEQREKRVVAWVALPAAILAVVAMYPVLIDKDSGLKDHAALAGLLLAAFACTTSLFSMVKDEGWRRGCGVLAMLMGLGVIAAMYMNDDGIPGLTDGPAETEGEGATEEGASEDAPPADAAGQPAAAPSEPEDTSADSDSQEGGKSKDDGQSEGADAADSPESEDEER